MHRPVLLEETVGAAAARPGETVLDCTAGSGGHAAMLARAIGPTGVLVLNDADEAALERSSAHVREMCGGTGSEGVPRVVAWRGNFAEAPSKMEAAGLRADVVLADLGFSSDQLEDAARGLSFMRDGPLDMRLDQRSAVTAAELVASLSEAELARLIREYGEEPAAGRIARKLVAARAAEPILTTGRLAELVRSAIGKEQRTIHPATRTFQAFRIAVNDELGSLDALLAEGRRGVARAARGEPGWLAAGARVAVISFHSLEDRAVKRVFADVERAGEAESVGPIAPGEAEVDSNPRSRSAKLRVLRLVRAQG
ncbi:MAG: 16S rRNA (cytosine(1402)-N(4))-methyltransferase RsmH [Phycisphaerales bacterium]